MPHIMPYRTLESNPINNSIDSTCTMSWKDRTITSKKQQKSIPVGGTIMANKSFQKRVM